MSAYLQRRREQYAAIRSEVTGVRDRAVSENRDLTPEELETVRVRSAELAPLADEIESLAAEETRARAVAEVQATLDAGAGTEPPAEQTRAATGEAGAERLTGTAQTRDRDPGHYRAVRDGGRHSWFADQFRARTQGDEAANQRLTEHNRAMDTVGAGTGLVAPKWLTDMFEPINRQGRRAASAVSHIDLGNDPRPMTIPKQTAGTDSVVAAQANENDPVSQTDAMDTDVVTVAPKVTAGAQNFSRQMLDMSDPAIDQMIYTDLLSVYDHKIEAKVCAAAVAAAGAATATYATEAAWTTGLSPKAATFVGDAVIDAAIAARTARKLPADLILSSLTRYGSLLKIKDDSGRPLMPVDSAGSAVLMGVGDVQVDGRFQGLPLISTEGVDGYPESLLVLRASDVILFESALMRFRFEEISGPETIRVGIWGYSATYVKYAGAGVKRLVITAAS